MKIRLDQIRDEPFTWRESLSFSLDEIDREELAKLSPVVLVGRLTRLEKGLLLRAELEYEQTLVCDRCLKEYVEPVAEQLDLLVEEGKPPVGSSDHTLDAEDLGVLYVENEVLDTGPLAFEQVQLGLPMKPLCRPDCPGFCPTCGADLSAGACGCQTETTDPRWAALAALRDRL
ncbi:MAG TPA: DUF177 domain-containing protein [Thermoanaerobaculia bacterium]|nr:DUF177 domain-containing protein [Thermoanaerobaculia bacterium]